MARPLVDDRGRLLTSNEADAAVLQSVLSCWGLTRFPRKPYIPGMNPRSILREDLALLGDNYLVSAKCDGERAQILLFKTPLGQQNIVVLNRAFCSLFGPVPVDAGVLGDTLLDCELVNGELVPHDLVRGNGISFLMTPFSDRLLAIERVLGMLRRRGVLQSLPWPVREKRFTPLRETNLRELVAGEHVDGLILAHRGGRLQAGISERGVLLKWKSTHTVDLWLYNGCWYHGRGNEVVPIAWTVHGSTDGPTGTQDALRATVDDMKNLGHVYELRVDVHPEVSLTVIKRRADKLTANDDYVIGQTIQNARENITLDELTGC